MPTTVSGAAGRRWEAKANAVRTTPTRLMRESIGFMDDGGLVCHAVE